jgi:hypothetical protein
METTTLTLINSDLCIVKEELYDVDRMDTILRDTNSYTKPDLGNLSRYKKNRKGGNIVTVVYELKGEGKKANLGRLYAKNCGSLQSFPSDIRNALLEKHYWDCDIVNAHYTILSRLADSWGLKTEAIQQYVQNREYELNKVSANRRIAKTAFLKVAYGGSIKLYNREYTDGISPDGDISLLKRIESEIKIIVDNCWMKYERYHKLVKKDNPKFSLFSLILQTEERRCLLAIDEFLKLNGRQMDIYIHDGGEIRKLEGEKEFPSDLLRKAEQYVFEKVGYPISLIIKPFQHCFVEPDKSNSYESVKKTFEDNHFKLMYPPCYVRVIDKKLQFLTKADLNLMYENLYYDTASDFIPRWLGDKTIRTYQKIVFKPKLEIEDTEYNLFQGFETEPVEGDITAVKKVLNLISNNDPVVADYIEKLMAHIIQKPYEKTQKCLIVYSPEEGAGKDTYFDLIGRILGDYFFNSASAKNDVLGKFNSQWRQSFLVKMEELNFLDTKENLENFKSIITAPNLIFQEKGKESIKLDNYTTFVATTNNNISVKVSDTNRRFVFVQASAERVGDIKFWNEIQPILHSKECASAYLHHLLNIDLSEFDYRESPVTDYSTELKKAFIPYSANFFQKEIEENPSHTEFEYTGRSLMDTIRSIHKFELSDYKIGVDLKVFSDRGVLVKKRYNSGIKYKVDKDAMQEFLKEKGWWYELPVADEE